MCFLCIDTPHGKMVLHMVNKSWCMSELIFLSTILHLLCFAPLSSPYLNNSKDTLIELQNWYSVQGFDQKVCIGVLADYATIWV